MNTDACFRHVAVMGIGSIGLRHCKMLTQIAGVRPVAVPARQERVQELRNAGFTAVHSLDEAVRQGAELCIIATDTGRHLADSARAVEKGLHLLVEKPLAIDTEEAKLLCAKARAANCKLFVACVLRFSKSLNKFRESLNDIGQLHSVRIECQSYLPDWRPERDYLQSYSARKDEGGVLRDLIHEIDYAGWLFGWPGTLQARTSNSGRLGIAAEEAADLVWETADGCLISIRLDYLSSPERRKMTAYGQRGTLEWDGVLNTVTLRSRDELVTEIQLAQTKNEMLLAQAEAFIRAVRGESGMPLATDLDGVRALAVCDAARRASHSRQEEKVEYQ